MGLLRDFSPSSTSATLIQVTVIIIVILYLVCCSQALNTGHLLASALGHQLHLPHSSQRYDIMALLCLIIIKIMMLPCVPNKTHTSHHVLLCRHNLGLFFPLSHSTPATLAFSSF